MNVAQAINAVASEAYNNSVDKGFHDADKNDPLARTLARIALVGSELSEFVEEFRLPSPNDALLAEELADVIIRVGDLAYSLNLDLGTAVVEKLEKNTSRPPMHGKRI